MVWSYSRLTTYEDCPYKFLLGYILAEQEARQFFSDYGSFVHDLLASFYSGNVKKEDLLLQYLAGFCFNVAGKPPSRDIHSKYFSDGVSAMKNPFVPAGKVLSVEHEFSFSLQGHSFVGFSDLITEDAQNGICIVDHKTRILKPKSGRKKPTKSDLLLDRYFRQLYLYAAALEFEQGVLPSQLCFNCFRSGTQIIHQFEPVAFEETKSWALSTIESIHAERDWNPNFEYFKCKNICGFHDACAYYQMMGGDKP